MAPSTELPSQQSLPRALLSSEPSHTDRTDQCTVGTFPGPLFRCATLGAQRSCPLLSVRDTPRHPASLSSGTDLSGKPLLTTMSSPRRVRSLLYSLQSHHAGRDCVHNHLPQTGSSLTLSQGLGLTHLCVPSVWSRDWHSRGLE